MDNAAFFGNNLPSSNVAVASNCKKLSLYLSLTLCSNVPNPLLCALPDKVSVPRSAKVKSTLPSAAQPPSSSKLDKRNSFTQTSAHAFGVVALVFSTPISIPLTSAKLGLPNIEYTCPLV